jgi:hypothetical protein
MSIGHFARRTLALSVSVTVLSTWFWAATAQTDRKYYDRQPWWKAPKGMTPAAAPEPKAEVKVTPAATTAKPAPVPMTMDDMVRTAVAYPTGNRASSMILVEKAAPRQVGLGQDFEYEIKVTNLTDVPVQDVVLAENLPATFKMQSANPPAAGVQGTAATWNLGVLGPHESKTIKVKGSATGTGTLVDCATVTYNAPACLKVVVVEPKLELAASGPADVLLCDTIPVKFTVKNSGTGPITNTKVVAALPQGLTTLDGQTQVQKTIGTLPPGATQEFVVTAKATNPGKYSNRGDATADGNLKAASNEVVTQVHQPVLTVQTGCPKTVLNVRDIPLDLTVSNTGDAASANTVLEGVIPDNVSFVSATDGGKFEGGKVTWNLGTLAPKATKKVTIKVTPKMLAGTVGCKASVTGACAKAANDACQTSVLGIPAILLEVIDVDDPIEVGKQETYVITATNQGTATDSNIRIVCELEPNMEYVSSTGATQGTLKGATIEFAPLAQLESKARATWRVVVKGVKAGDVRFKVKMTTDQLTRPVEETEATYLYE